MVPESNWGLDDEFDRCGRQPWNLNPIITRSVAADGHFRHYLMQRIDTSGYRVVMFSISWPEMCIRTLRKGAFTSCVVEIAT